MTLRGWSPDEVIEVETNSVLFFDALMKHAYSIYEWSLSDRHMYNQVTFKWWFNHNPGGRTKSWDVVEKGAQLLSRVCHPTIL